MRRNKVELGQHARQRAAAGHRAVVHHTAQHMNVFAGQTCPGGVDVALPIAHDGDGRRLPQHRLGLMAGIDPAARFLVLELALGVRALDPALAGVDRAAHQPHKAAVVGVHGHHCMHQKAAARAFPDLAEAAPPAGLGLEVDLARILDGQHVPAGRSGDGLFAPARDQAIGRHLLVGQEAPKSNLSGAAALAEFAQADRSAHDHAIEQYSPLLSRRLSPNWPSDRFSSDMTTPRSDSTCRRQNHTSELARERNFADDLICRTQRRPPRRPRRAVQTGCEMCASRRAPLGKVAGDPPDPVRGRPEGVWPAASTSAGLHEGRSALSPSHPCTPHPIRPFGPPPGRRPGQALPRFAEKGVRFRLRGTR